MLTTQKILNNVIRVHKLWLEKHPHGVRADLSYHNLNGMDLSGADLSYANLTNTQLKWTNLENVNFTGAILEGANTFEAVTTGANFALTFLAPQSPIDTAGVDHDRA